MAAPFPMRAASLTFFLGSCMSAMSGVVPSLFFAIIAIGCMWFSRRSSRAASFCLVRLVISVTAPFCCASSDSTLVTAASRSVLDVDLLTVPNASDLVSSQFWIRRYASSRAACPFCINYLLETVWARGKHAGAGARRGGEEWFELFRRDRAEGETILAQRSSVSENPLMPHTLLTIGYQQRTLDEFLAILVDSGVDVLVDVRETAWSHKRGFSKTAFEAALTAEGIEYVHADFAGNPKWLRANADSHRECLDWYDWYLTAYPEIVPAFEGLVDDHLRAGRRVCVTCFERHAGDCHRAILAERWRKRGRREVRHLAIEGCERLLSAKINSSWAGRLGYQSPMMPKFFGCNRRFPRNSRKS